MCGRFTNAAGAKEFDDRYSHGRLRSGTSATTSLRLSRCWRSAGPGGGRGAGDDAFRPDPTLGAAAERRVQDGQRPGRDADGAGSAGSRELIESHRCLVLADGFYEWAAEPNGRRRPIRFTVDGGRLFAFAGLWSSWRDPETDEWIDSAAIVTTAPNALVARVHDRMPVILRDQGEHDWLDPGTSVRHALEVLLVPFPAERMGARPVSDAVNSVRNDHPCCWSRDAVHADAGRHVCERR